jgi:hypothetical protein
MYIGLSSFFFLNIQMPANDQENLGEDQNTYDVSMPKTHQGWNDKILPLLVYFSLNFQTP